MHPIQFISEKRKWYVLQHFSGTKYAKQLKAFQNIHQGETCFIIGNGPSLRVEDLEQLSRKNIPTFAFNRIYLMFDNTGWRPTYYISQDEKTLKNCVKQVNEMELKYKFIPLFIHYYHDVTIDDAYYFHLIRQTEKFPTMEKDISCGIGDSTTVAVTAAQMAVYMGFQKIYLIGIDHSFSTYKNDKGEIIHDNLAKDYFTSEYNKDKAKLYMPNLDASTRAFISMKSFCDKNGIEVVNATRGGKLEVFPRADFDEILKKL